MVRSHSSPKKTVCAQQTHLSAVKNSLSGTAMMFGALRIFTGMEETTSWLMTGPASTILAVGSGTHPIAMLLILSEHEKAQPPSFLGKSI